MTGSRLYLSAGHVEDLKLKRIIDDDETLAQGRTVRADQELDVASLAVGGVVEIVKRRLASELSLSRDDRDYVQTFDERDATLDAWRVRFMGYPGKHWRLRGAWEDGSYDARGDDPATALVEDDLSSRRGTVAADVRYEFGDEERQRVQIGWERENRRFTSPSPFDFYHYGRTDRRTTWGFSWRMSLPHGLAVEAAVVDESNRSSFAVPPPMALPPNDTTDYDTTTMTAGISWRRNLDKTSHRR